MEHFLTEFVKKPPLLPSGLGLFIKEITPYLLGTNEAFEDQEYLNNHRQLLQTICRALPVMLDLQLKTFKQNIENHNLESTICSGMMGLFFVMSYLVIIIEDRVESGKPWRLGVAADVIGNGTLIEHKLVSSAKPIKSYTRDDMSRALYVLAVYWYRLDSSVLGLEEYLNALFHRMCILSVSYDEDIEKITTGADGVARDAKEIENTVMRLVTSRSRHVVQILRMLWLLRFQKNTCEIIEEDPLIQDENNIRCMARMREFGAKTVKVLSRTREAKAEVREVFPRLAQLHGDVETFVNIRGMENARPVSLLMTVRPESQQAISQVHQFVLLERIQEKMNDEDPDYFDKFTRFEHIYAVLLKAYIVNMALKEHNINFYKDYVVYEMNLPFFADQIARCNEPVLVQLFSRLHVLFRGKIYKCACIEMAIVTWLRLVLHQLSGRLNKVDVTKAIKFLLGQLNAAEEHHNQTVILAHNIVTKGKIVVD